MTSRKILFILIVFPWIIYGQKIGGVWKLDRIFLKKGRGFQELKLEKHPFDVLHFKPDGSFYIECSNPNNADSLGVVANQWVIDGQWRFRRNKLLLSNMKHGNNPSDEYTVVYKVLQNDSSLYINYGFKDEIYVRYRK